MLIGIYLLNENGYADFWKETHAYGDCQSRPRSLAKTHHTNMD